MGSFAIHLLAEGFLHPATRLDREIADAQGITHVPVAELGTELQFFWCRVESSLAAGPIEYVVTDSGSPADCGVAERFLGGRFPGSTTLFLRSQNTGRAVVDCTPGAWLTQSAAAAVAVVLYSAAGDDSESIAIEGGGAHHVLAVVSDDTIYRVKAL